MEISRLFLCICDSISLCSCEASSGLWEGCPFSFDKLGKKRSCLEITPLPEHKIKEMGLVNTHTSYNPRSLCTFPSSCFWSLLVPGVKAGPEDPSAGAAPAAPGHALPAHPHHEIRVHRWAPLPSAPQDSGRNVSLAVLTPARGQAASWREWLG